MNTVHDVVDLEAAPAIPGGGPTGRWRAARFTSGFAWTWLALLLACPVVVATVVVASRRHGELTSGGVMTLLVAGVVLLVLLCGVHAAVTAAVEGRIDDDMREYGVGRRSVLHWRRGAAGLSVDAPLEVGGQVVGRVERHFADGAFRSRLVLGVSRWRWSVRPGRLALIPADGHEGADAEPVAIAVAHAHGNLRDWEIEVDGMLLRVREHRGRPLPRRTLLDEQGRAWLVRCVGRSVGGRLPTGLSDLGRAFCLLVLAELWEIAGASSEVGGGGGWSDSDGSGADWSDWSSSDSSWSSDGQCSGGSPDGGWFGGSSDGGWFGGSDGGWSGGCSSDSGGGWSW